MTAMSGGSDWRVLGPRHQEADVHKLGIVSPEFRCAIRHLPSVMSFWAVSILLLEKGV
jgi:hypothetical protein